MKSSDRPDRPTNTSDCDARIEAADAAARRVFGDADEAGSWLATQNPALGGEPPLRVLRTAGGAVGVEAVLVRIEHGVYE